MTEPSLLRVGFFSNNAWPWMRQTPNGDGVWGRCQFVFDGQGPLDYAVVYDGAMGDLSLPLPASRVLFVASEPVNVKRYSPSYTRQFGTIVSADAQDPHPRRIACQAGLPWHYGILTAQPDRHGEALSFRALDDMTLPAKTKTVSVICSNKSFTPEHARRLRFVEELKAIMGDRVDVFGRGFREIGDKAEVLAAYRYHVALENCDFADYWTEKIADPFLGRAFPFYWGCRNLERYFPAESFMRLDINDPRASAELISRAVADGTFEKRREAAEEARRRVLYEHNLFAMLEREIVALHKEPKIATAKGKTVIRQSVASRTRNILGVFPPLLTAARAVRNWGRRRLKI